MPLHVYNGLKTVNAICNVCKVSPHIPRSVNDSTTLVNQVSDNATNAEFATNDATIMQLMMLFNSKVLVTSIFKHVFCHCCM